MRSIIGVLVRSPFPAFPKSVAGEVLVAEALLVLDVVLVVRGALVPGPVRIRFDAFGGLRVVVDYFKGRGWVLVAVGGVSILVS